MSANLICRERLRNGIDICYTQMERNQSGVWFCPNAQNHRAQSQDHDDPPGGGRRSNTNRGKGEDRNQSFGGESHTMQPKGGGNQRSGGRSGRYR